MKKHSNSGTGMDNKISITNATKPFPIVGIGASAGGLEALEQFFTNVPAEVGMAFVVIQHLDPNHKGIMPELMQRFTKMKVIQARDRLKVKPDCVYVIPPNKSLSLLNGALHLFEPVQAHGLRLPIDIFFRALAEDRQDQSIGIILSGMGSDGSLGLKAIKEKNGITLVQDPASAKFDGMPVSASKAVNVDIIAPVDELPAKLISYLNFMPSDKVNTHIDKGYQSNLDKIVILIRNQTGHDFSLYKKNTLFRRVERRKAVHQIEHINNYVRFLQENENEIDILFNELLIGVTSFFRDPELWEALKDKILPALLKKLPDGHIVRAWVPGCSTGEEAYALAIVFKEAIEQLKLGNKLSLQVFATDIDNDAIDIARKGIFKKNIAADISPERLNHFFTGEAGGYRLKSVIRDMVVFASQNVIKDPPFTKLDFLSCRNMLIYMEPELQERLIAVFNYSLRVGGIMVLGTSETLGSTNNGFIVRNSKLKIFERAETLPSVELMGTPSSFFKQKTTSIKDSEPSKKVENLQTLADQILLQRFAPASMLVNEKGDILYLTGQTGKYLELPAGKANWNVHAMARDGLRQALPAAFRKAIRNFEAVIIKKLKVGTNGGTHIVNITIQQIENPLALKGMFFLVFNDVNPVIEPDTPGPKSPVKASAKRQKELEIELQRSSAELQEMREEMQTSQEELKSTNEELQSTNEELQSTNEELTTSKEEMQSLNEELQTVNVELQSKVSDYMRTNDDMKNLLNSTEIATLFLDKELKIRRFTDNISNIFKIRASDIGRPFTDLVNDLKYPDIATHAEQVIRTLSSIETAIETRDHRWFNIRIMPYRTLDDRIDGVVLTFTNITAAKELEIELTAANNKLRGIK